MYRNGLPMFVLQPGSPGPVPYSASLSHPIFTTFWSPVVSMNNGIMSVVTRCPLPR